MQTVSQLKKHSTAPVHFKALSVDSDGKLVGVDSRIISGYAAAFNNVDDAQDMIIKGAFTKSINERGPQSSTNRKIVLLAHHDMKDPIGRITKLEEDEKGLYFEAELDKIPEADNILTQLNSGTLNQFSIGFKYVWDKTEYDQEKSCFICKEINLFEISVVSVGCNELTGFEGMKAAELESHANQLDRDTEKVLKTLPQDTQYEVRQLISKHIALATAEPLPALKEPDKPQFDINEAIKNAKIF